MRDLRQMIASIPTYDGLYASVPGHGKHRVYRNRALLVTGRASLLFLVQR
jgi:hypothetical protein